MNQLLNGGAGDEGSEVLLISKWQLLDGAPGCLIDILKKLASEVENAEPDTLMYRVHLQSTAPLEKDSLPKLPPPRPLSNESQKEVIFLEVYRDADAFSRHVLGDVFQHFLQEVRQYFKEDPDNAGQPLMQTEYLTLESGFARF